MKQIAAFLLVLLGIALTLIALAFFVAIYGCAPLKVGPFPQARHIPCSHEAGCPQGYRCAFAKTDVPAACLWVARGYDDVLDRMPEGP